MAEEKAEQGKESKDMEKKPEEKKPEAIKAEQEKKTEEGKKPDEKKKDKEKPKTVKKEEALAYGRNAPISTKHAIAICKAIKGEKIDEALRLLDDIVKMKKAIPFRAEIPHRKHVKGDGMMSGRYPVKAAGYFIKLVKSLGANAENCGIETETARIYFANANRASRPHKRHGMRFKRTHVLLKLREEKIKQNGSGTPVREEKIKQTKA